MEIYKTIKITSTQYKNYTCPYWNLTSFFCHSQKYCIKIYLFRTKFSIFLTNFSINLTLIFQLFLPEFSKSKFLHVCVCMCVCVCVRACVCVFILFHLLVSSGCTTSVTYVRCSDQRSFAVSITTGFCQVPSSPFPNLSYLTSKDENSSRQFTGEKTIWYNVPHEKVIYIDIGYKSAPT